MEAPTENIYRVSAFNRDVSTGPVSDNRRPRDPSAYRRATARAGGGDCDGEWSE